jgi:hypothetical protein
MVCHRAPGRHPRRCASLGGRLAGDAVHRRSCGKLGCSPGRARNARDPDRDRAASAECGAQFASQPIRAVCARMRSGGGPSPGRTSRRAERPPGSLRARCATHRVEITLALGHQNFHDKLVRECVVALAQRNAGAEAALEGRDEVGALVLADEVRAARSEPGDECWVVALDGVLCLADHGEDGLLAVTERAVWVCDAAGVDGVGSRASRLSHGGSG